jgi:YfiR/HmsC-like
MDLLSLHCKGARFRPIRFGTQVLAVIVTVCATQAMRSPPAVAQSEPLSEYQVKAAFLFNFAKFIEWPADLAESSSLILCVVGEDPFGGDLSRVVEGQSVRGRTIAIRRDRFGDDLRSCHVLFVSESETKHVPQILAGLQGHAVLTVSDIDGFAQSGGVLQFFMEQSHVRFIVNLEAASQAKLKINSKLLALARVLNHADPGGY